MADFFTQMLWAYYLVWENGHGGLNPYFIGMLLEIWLLALVVYLLVKLPKCSFSVLIDMMFEKVYEFFEEILGVEEKKWTKLYITTMFFVILFSNLIGAILELVGVGYPSLHHLIHIPTSDINFNIAMAVVGVCIVIYEQFAFLGFGKAIYEYLPVLGKDYIPFQRWKLPAYIDWPVFLLIKAFDIVISLFLWVLEIVGHGAKIISLSFRLFGNITSGGLLLWMLLAWLAALTWGISDWFQFPIIFPIILHLQWLLVAVIQALVFPLLIAIFIKVAKVH